MSLITERRLSRHQWTMVPMTDSAIDRVEQMAALEKQPWIHNSGMLMEWRPSDPVEDDDDPDHVYTEEVDNDEDDYLRWDELYVDEDTVATANLSDDQTMDSFGTAELPVVNGDPDDKLEVSYNQQIFDVEDDNLSEESETVEVPQIADEVAAIPARYNLRTSRDRSYDHRFDHLMDNPHNTKSYESPVQLLQHSTQQTVTAYVLAQISAARGMIIYGKPFEDAILKEFCQLHDKGVFEPKHAEGLSQQEKRASLRAVNLIKEKRNGDIKGRICADGSVQRDLYNKAETSSPTVSNEALMYTIIVDAKEHRDVATADVVGAYLTADMVDFTLMKLTGDAVYIMLKVDQSYSKFVTTENGKRTIYLQ
jgi:hypothetical protein